MNGPMKKTGISRSFLLRHAFPGASFHHRGSAIISSRGTYGNEKVIREEAFTGWNSRSFPNRVLIENDETLYKGASPCKGPPVLRRVPRFLEIV